MAINPEALYPGKIAPGTPDYPYGAARNITTPGDGTGTPWEAALVNDLFGFQQALLSAAGIVPSGSPDKVGASQYVDAVSALIDSGGLMVFADVAGLKSGTTLTGKNASYAAGKIAITGTTLWRITTNATSTPITGGAFYADPLTPFVDVQDFGAASDGSTDDLAPMQAADVSATPFKISNVSADVENQYGLELAPKNLIQNNVSGRMYNPKSSLDNYFFGMETLQHWFSLFDESSNKNGGNANAGKIVCTGDSTTFGVGGTYGGVPAILEELAKMRGYPNVSVVNNGQSAQATIPWPATGLTDSWKTTFLALDIAEDPDLLIVRWGANDPFYNVSPLGDSGGSPVDDRDTVLDKVIQGYRETLTLLRNTSGMGVGNLSVILATPGPMNDVFFGRDEVYFQRLSKALKQMALDFQCAYVDIYGLYSNSWGGVNKWMDADGTSGTLRAVHPHDELYEHIAGAIAELALPDWGLNWKANGFRNTSATAVNRLPGDAPNTYFAGINLDRMGDGTGDTTGKPYNGVAETFKQADGATLQLNYPLDYTQGAGISARFGFNSVWNPHFNGAVYTVSSLGYQNGWTDFGSGFETPTYKISLSGTVELAGVVKAGTTADATVLFTLPVGFRPSNTVICHAGTENGDCLILIAPSGDVSLTRFGAGGAYLMLNAVTFPVY